MISIKNNFFVPWGLLSTLFSLSPHINASQALVPYHAPLSLAIQLHIATKNNNSAYAADLITHGADVNHRDPRYNNAPLWYALRNKNYDIARLLINAGADAQARCCFQHPNGYMVHEPLLFYAVRQNNPESIQLCIDAGAPVDTDNMGQSALSIAAQNNHVRAIVTLIKAGTDITQKDSRGFSALWFALRSNAREAVKKLLELGAGTEALEHLQEETMRTLMVAEHYQLMAFCIERGALIDKQTISIKCAPDADNIRIQNAHHAIKKETVAWLQYIENEHQLPRDLSRLIGQMLGLHKSDNLPQDRCQIILK